MVIANESTTELPVPVLEGPHWRVALHPGEHGTERILSNDACWGVMWRARVGWRPPEYPILGSLDDQGEGDGWISSSMNHGPFCECWRFYQNGEFVQYRGLWLEKREHEEALRQFANRHPSGHQPCGHVEVDTLISTPLEIFTFASRLGAAAMLIHEPTIEIGFHGLEGHVLFSTNARRGEAQAVFPAQGDEVTFQWKPSRLTSSRRPGSWRRRLH